MKARVTEIVNNRWLIFSLRVALGSIFIAASVSKIPHQAEFTSTVTSYGILPDNLAHFYGSVLPWAELFIGCCLVLGIFSRFASTLSLPLIVSFIIASTYGLSHQLEGGCGCFGQQIPMSYSVSLAIDVVMLVTAVQLLLHKDKAEFLSMGRLLSRRKPGVTGKERRKPMVGERRRFISEKSSKFAIVALAVLAIGMPLACTQGPLHWELSSPVPMIDQALGKPAFLYFHVEGCPECEREMPIVEELKKEYTGKINFIDINCSNPEGGAIATAFGFTPRQRFPIMLLITAKDGEREYVGYRLGVGFTDKEKLKDGIEQVLGD